MHVSCGDGLCVVAGRPAWDMLEVNGLDLDPELEGFDTRDRVIAPL